MVAVSMPDPDERNGEFDALWHYPRVQRRPIDEHIDFSQTFHKAIVQVALQGGVDCSTSTVVWIKAIRYQACQSDLFQHWPGNGNQSQRGVVID